ncbi:MAG: hypothetical protein M0D57_08540 [Sphingobacteriales bacterium JAD_PAG50586_3]|nr:MAG: hypothetical protein M0D57_08540 [Sphingobacteriales bacterium JAD_PAG50586_3]
MKSIKLLLICCFLFSVKPLLCQYSITAIEPAGIFNFSDLWSFSIVKTTSDNTLEYLVKMDISKQGEGMVISANSTRFTLDAPIVNINQGNRSKLEPLSMNYSGGFSYSTILANNSRLPEGTYIIHLTLLECDGPIKQVVAAETDYTLVIDPMAVIFQTSPMDADTLCEEVPMYSWVYSNPLLVDNTITYKLIMVELADGQNQYDGIMYNPPYFVEENFSSTFLQYPVSARGLIPGKIMPIAGNSQQQ